MSDSHLSVFVLALEVRSAGLLVVYLVGDVLRDRARLIQPGR